MRSKLTGSGIGAQTPFTKYRKELLKVADDVIGKEKSYYRLKDMNKQIENRLMSGYNEWMLWIWW